MSHDVTFTINAGDHKGDKYKYTLASKDGAKMWSVTPQFRPCPSMIKEKIEMVIEAREGNIPQSGAVELRLVQKIVDELSIIAKETDVTLTGLDLQDRPVMIDEEGFNIAAVANEKTRSPEYQITVRCWGLHD